MYRNLFTGAAALAMAFVATGAGAAGSPPPVDPTRPLASSFTAGLTTIYDNRAAFAAAAGATLTNNFEFTPTNTTVPSIGFSTGSFTDANGTTFALSTLPAQPNNGVVDLNLLDSTYLPSTGGYIGKTFVSDVLGSNYSKVTFTFDHAITSFGLDFGSYGQGFTNKSDIFAFAVTGLGTQTAFSTSGAPTFFGFTSTLGFTSITIDTASTTQRVYDNVTISAPSDVAAVPEPATWAMFIGGFGLIGGAMRRRKAAVSFA